MAKAKKKIKQGKNAKKPNIIILFFFVFFLNIPTNKTNDELFFKRLWFLSEIINCCLIALNTFVLNFF